MELYVSASRAREETLLYATPEVARSEQVNGPIKSSREAIGATSADNGPVAYDEDLAERIRELVQAEDGVSEMRAFGGLAFLISGNMAISASGQGGLMVRVDPADTEALLAESHARPFEMRGRQMKGWLRVDIEGLRTERQLKRWVTRGVSYARTLPSKDK